MDRVVVIGLGVTGRAVATALTARNIVVDAVDDRITDEMTTWAESIGISVTSPTPDGLTTLIRGADAVLPTPGLPDAHPTFSAAAAAGVAIWSEFDLARLWDDRPIVAVTGTDGKTTVVTLTEQMLNASGKRSLAVGNTETPLVAAIDDDSYDVFVVEASSFRLGHSHSFSPDVATWLNFGPDHLDAHADLKSYERAKASIWAHLGDHATAIANRDDSIVMSHLADISSASTETFGADDRGEHGIRSQMLVLAGEPLINIAELPRQLPHDLMNGLAAGASALRSGACRQAVADVLRDFTGLRHRVQLVGEIDGVRFVNDSKATTPHAAAAAVKAFDSVVLLAGGRNKGLDLGELTQHAGRIRHVVALGEAAAAVQEAFGDTVDSTAVTSMSEAIDVALAHSQPGDVVLLSPACASYDWYSSYGQRGDDFIALVEQRIQRSLV